jgi:hypothetical protein
MFLKVKMVLKMIQDGDWGADADSMSSMNQGPC